MSHINFLLLSHCTVDKDILPGDIMKSRVLRPFHEMTKHAELTNFASRKYVAKLKICRQSPKIDHGGIELYLFMELRSLEYC